MVYRFGRFELNGARYELRRDGRPLAVEPRVLELLAYLVAHRDRVVSKEELLDTLWKEADVSEWALTRTVRKARAPLDDPGWIRVVYGRGYKFEAPVVEAVAAAPPTPAAIDPESGGIAPGVTPAAAPPAAGRRIAFVAAAGLFAVLAAALWIANRPGAVAPAQSGIRSLAVLPLRDLSGEAGEEYFAEGLTEALIARLANLGGLRVISRTSAMRYRDSTRALPEIARELGVEAALVGSVLRSGDRVRINVRLVRAATGEHLWASEYEREVHDLLDVQAEIARSVAAAVELELSADEASRLARTGPIDGEAYRRYLLGRFSAGHRTIEGLEAGLVHLEEAIRLAPGFAPAHAAHADVCILLSSYYGMRPEVAFPRARSSAVRAHALDPLLSEAHAALGTVAFAIDWDLPASERAYRRAIELAPGNAAARQGLGEVLSLLGRHEEAIEEGRRAVELDPFSAVMHASLGQRLNAAGREREALEELASTLDFEPRFAWLHRERAYAFARLGETRSALAERILEMETRGVDAARLAELRSLAESGEMTAFWRWEAARLAALAGERYVPALLFAEAAEGTGDRERALEQLARAVEERGIHLLQLTTSPELASLASDPRGRARLSGAGIEPPSPEAGG